MLLAPELIRGLTFLSISFCCFSLLYYPLPTNNYLLSSMDTPAIQKQCEAFLKNINANGFIVLGFQNGEQVDIVYSMKEMPIKGVVKGLTGILNDLITRI